MRSIEFQAIPKRKDIEMQMRPKCSPLFCFILKSR